MNKLINKIHNLPAINLLKKLNSESIDLIYIDPPYNTHRDFGDFDDNYGSMKDYIKFLKPIFKQIYRVLKETGSFYLHVDPSVSHYLKVELDKIFGIKNFRNEIVWCYKRWTTKSNRIPNLHDVILFYSKSNKYNFNQPMTPNDNPSTSQYVSTKNNNGKTIVLRDASGNAIKREIASEIPIPDYWNLPIISPNAKERIGYPTQKPEALLERIILASSNPGDTVADFFLGGGTTIAVAERLGRNWIGCDINPRAVEISSNRINSLK